MYDFVKSEFCLEVCNISCLNCGAHTCLNSQEDRNAVATLWSEAVVPYVISPELGGLLWSKLAVMLGH